MSTAQMFNPIISATVTNNTAQLVPQNYNNLTVSSNAITLTPQNTTTPALYLFSIAAPSGYSFNGQGSNLTYGSNGVQAYAVLVGSEWPNAMMVGIDDMTANQSIVTNTLVLTVTSASSALPLTATISFNPPAT